MSVDLNSLVRQCIRWKVEPSLTSTHDSAHALLETLPMDQRAHLEWIAGAEWQLSFSGKLIYAGSFEDCVTTLAARCSP